MDELRHIKQSNLLRVAAADIMESVPLMVVSDHLTELAVELLNACFDLAWRQLIKKHGRPVCGDHRVCDTGFAVIAYGKLGGIELGYGSDLDVVFLHSHDSDGRSTNGSRPLENSVFYARLGQRVIHLMNTRTRSGVLYEIDTRLRPSGASGMLVSSIDAFAEYQRKQAWTWEHQALVRARVVSGDQGIAEAFEQIRHEILCQQRDLDELKKEVSSMRLKMFEALSSGGEGLFDLKQDRGGIADIEFMVQYGVLAWAHKYPSLTRWTDNIRLLEDLAECGILSDEDAQLLCDAYRNYRACAHRMTLLDEKSVINDDRFAQTRDEVIRIWNELIGTW
jgi:glutamate-ammonia-ligase adenylyltransferase